MTAQETIQLIEALKAAGVNHFKQGNLVISFSPPPIKEEVKELTPIEAPVPVPEEIKHKVEELTSLLKLSDTELVDQLFPDHTRQEDEEVIQ